jgi:hypothetical protein
MMTFWMNAKPLKDATNLDAMSVKYIFVLVLIISAEPTG